MIPSDRVERWIFGVALAAALLSVGLRALGPDLEFTDWFFLDRLARMSTDSAPPTDPVTLVVIDDDGLVRMGERWPLSRNTWAQFLRAVAVHEPAAVALDAWFETPAPRGEVELALDVADQIIDQEFGDTPRGSAMVEDLEKMAAELDGDRQFSAALADLGRVVVGMVCADGRQGIDIGKNALPRPLKISDLESNSYLRCDKLAASIAPLAVAAHTQAGLNVPADRDGMIRRYPFIFRVQDDFYPSLALAAAMAANPEDATGLLARAAQLKSPRPLLRYQSKDDFRVLRFGDILEADKDSPGLKTGIKGKILVVGVSAQGTEDLVRTPVHGNIPGLVIHASAIAGLLENSFVSNHEENTRKGALAGLLLLLLLAWFTRNPRGGGSVIIRGAFAMALWWVAATYGVHKGALIPTGTVLGGIGFISLGSLGIIFYRGQNARQRTREIRRAFAFYLSPAVVEELIADPTKLKLGGERREITAYFSDVMGFTSIAEQMTPADLVTLLNECLGTMTEIILEEGGTIDKYIGDAVVAMFGAPVHQEDHSLRACRAALRCQEALTDLRKTWMARGWPEVRVRIGMHTGVAVVGNMGSHRRFDYTMMGDTVNQAARLEGVNKVYQTWIVASHDTMEACGDGIVARELDTVVVKGRVQGVRIYEPLAIADHASHEQVALAQRFTEGLSAWRNRQWSDARKIFGALAVSGDAPSAVFLARLEQIEAQSPPDEWDGVYVMKSK
jgi:adenylate cyclase